MALTGIPTRLGVGNGQSALLHGDGSTDAHYKLYVVETAGAALSVVVSIEDLHGQTRAEKRLFLDRFEHVSADTRDLFPAVNSIRPSSACEASTAMVASSPRVRRSCPARRTAARTR